MSTQISDRVREIAKIHDCPESEVVTRALERGLQEIHRDIVVAKYTDDKLPREEAVEKLGRIELERIERDGKAVEDGHRWDFEI